MISFVRDDGRFKYRAVGVCLDEGHVLLHRAGNARGWQQFWSLPGGRCEMMESSADAVAREFREELVVTVQIERLSWVVENFYTRDGVRCHELAFYYLLVLPVVSALRDKARTYDGTEGDGVRLMFRWFALDALRDLTLVPPFLKDGLVTLPATPEHLVQCEG